MAGTNPIEPGGLGQLRRAIYCDESGISGDQKHYGFGALFIAYQRRGQFVAEIREIRAKHGSRDDELKWNKCSRGNVGLYVDLVDYFFRSPFLFFHTMLVERAWVNTKLYHGGSFDMARRKHFTSFVANKVNRIVKTFPGRQVWTRVYADKLPSSYVRASEVMGIIGNRSVQKMSSLGGIAGAVNALDGVIECDSKEYVEIQLCDILLGAVVDTWNEGSTSPHKAKLKRHIAGHLGWPDLRSDTHVAERKFNIWWLTDKIHEGDCRPVVTRQVQLRHPLPRMRKWTSPGGTGTR